MHLKICKYDLPNPPKGNFSMQLHYGADIIAVRTQYDWPQILALINPDDQSLETRNFLIVETDQPIEPKIEDYKGTLSLHYVGNFQMRIRPDEYYDGHLFEVSKFSGFGK